MALTSVRPLVPPTALVMGAVLSVQVGSAIATHIFSAARPGGATFLRLAFGALILLVVWRPKIRGHAWSSLRVALLFGLVVAGMNLSFYTALDRIPLGIAVTLEFVGPLGVAVAGSRRMLDLVWVVLAAMGVVLLAPWGDLQLDGVGVIFAALAGAFWASYILLSARVGQLFDDVSGLTIALVMGSLFLLPFGVVGAGRHLVDPRVLAIGLCVGLLSSVIPYSLELEALRSLPTRAFGVLMSTEPAVGALVGFIFLRQALNLRAIVAIILVTAAAAGASTLGTRPRL